MTLRLLTHEQTGGIVAAPTTSLPEDFGGERNWDYRYCWLRDAALTLESLVTAGYTEEASLWRNWLLRAVAGDPEDLQVMYTVDGARRLPERTLDHLPGYEGSRPVRIGNAAVDQLQMDVLGEVMISLDEARRAGLAEDDDAWRLQVALVDDLADNWDRPDNGIWEIRGPRRHFTHSRVMVWAAFDRGIRAAEEGGLEAPLERWRAVRDAVRAEILEQGFDRERGTFTQHYDTTEVDASLLVLPLVGFVDGDDPMMLGTIEAIEQDLMRDGFLLRYRTQSGVDGVVGRRAPVPGLLVLAGLGVRRRGTSRRRARAVRPAGGPGQRRGAAVRGVRPRHRPDGGQLPAGLQPPHARAGGVPPRGPRLTPGDRQIRRPGNTGRRLCQKQASASHTGARGTRAPACQRSGRQRTALITWVSLPLSTRDGPLVGDLHRVAAELVEPVQLEGRRPPGEGLGGDLAAVDPEDHRAGGHDAVRGHGDRDLRSGRADLGGRRTADRSPSARPSGP